MSGGVRTGQFQNDAERAAEAEAAAAKQAEADPGSVEPEKLGPPVIDPAEEAELVAFLDDNPDVAANFTKPDTDEQALANAKLIAEVKEGREAKAELQDTFNQQYVDYAQTQALAAVEEG